MNIIKFKTSVAAVLSVLALSLLASSLAFAQEEAKKEEDKKEKSVEAGEMVLEEVVVQGYQSSLERSLEIKRLSDTVMDAVSAEDVGKFPDQTVADALQRVPGVQVERSEGTSDRVSIRGTAPHLNLTLLNGQNVASATASTSILKSSRGFNYSLLPTEIIKTLEVHKSAEAKIQEGSLGGTVIVRTRSPLDTDSGYAAFSAETMYQPSSGEHSPQLAGFYSWKNEESSFGFNLGAVYKDSFVRSDRYLVNGWGPVTLDGQELYTPDQARKSRFESEQGLETYTAALGWDATENLTITLDNLYSKADRDNIVTTMGTYVAGSRADVVPGEVAGGNIQTGTVMANPADVNWQREGYYSYNDQMGEYDTRVHNLVFDYRTDNWSLVTTLGLTEADGEITDIQNEYQSSADIDFDVAGNTVDYRYLNNSEADAFNGLYLHKNEISNDQQETYLQSDLNLLFDGKFFSDFDMGIKYRDHEKSSGLYKTVWHPDELGALILADFTDGSLVNDFMDDGERPQGMYNFDFAALQQWMANTAPLREYEHLDFSFELSEEITNAYFQANFDSGKWRGNVGLRYAKTKQVSEGFDYIRNPPWNPLAWTIAPIRVDRDYDDWLPSLNINYSWSEDLVFRFAAASVMARPDYDLLSPRRGYRKSVWSNPPNSGFQGNPYLDPYYADQFDLSAEYYFSDSSVVSVAYFYKDIETYIDAVYVPTLLPDEEGNWDEYNLLTPVNMDGGVNQGVELNVQHYFDNGFGLLGNYTFAKANMDEPGAELPNHSENTFNATVYYEGDKFAARLSYNFRDDYYRGPRGSLDWFQEGYGQFDANFSYTFGDHYTLTLQILNLTEEDQESNLGPDRLYNLSHYGRRVFAGISANF